MKVVDSFFSVGLPLLEKRVLCVTQAAKEALQSASTKLEVTRKDATFNALDRATTLQSDQDGNVPNVALLPVQAFIICTLKEAHSFKGRWTFIV